MNIRIKQGVVYLKDLYWLTLNKSAPRRDWIHTPMSQLLKAYFRTVERHIEKRVDVNTHYCFTPLLKSNGEERSPFNFTSCIPEWRAMTRSTKRSGHPSFRRIFQRATLLTVSNVLVKSTKTIYNGMFYLTHFPGSPGSGSDYDLPAWKLNCSSGSTSSDMLVSRLGKISGIDNYEIPLQLAYLLDQYQTRPVSELLV